MSPGDTQTGGGKNKPLFSGPKKDNADTAGGTKKTTTQRVDEHDESLKQHAQSIKELEQILHVLKTQSIDFQKQLDEKFKTESQKVDNVLGKLEDKVRAEEEKLNSAFEKLESRMDKQSAYMMQITVGIGFATLVIVITVGMAYVSDILHKDSSSQIIKLSNENKDGIQEINELNAVKFRLNGLESRIEAIEP